MVLAVDRAHRGAVRLLCGVDGSAIGPQVADVAGHLAAGLGAGLTLMRVVPAGTFPAPIVGLTVPIAPDAANGEAGRALQGLDSLGERVAAEHELRPARRLESGNAGEQLLAAAQDGAYDMIVIGRARRGRLGDAFLGETRKRLVHRAACPVMLVPPDVPTPAYDEIAVAYDASAPAGEAVAVAARLASQLGDVLTIIHVLPDPRWCGRSVAAMVRWTEDTVRAAAGASDLELRHLTAHARPAVDLQRTLDPRGSVLVVTPAPMRSAWGSVLRPDVGRAVLKRAVAPVVVVPAGAGLGSSTPPLQSVIGGRR
ncbi:MAG TPA: universal stress protein [Solirubrobacteraceae bacterium]|nr:universal stress protein [Solirubrobacteraceae bacterium]